MLTAVAAGVPTQPETMLTVEGFELDVDYVLAVVEVQNHRAADAEEALFGADIGFHHATLPTDYLAIEAQRSIAAGTELHDDLAAAIDVNRGVVQRDYVAAIVTAAQGCFAMAAHGTVDGIVPREAGTAGAAITIIEARTAVIGTTPTSSRLRLLTQSASST